MGMKNSQNTVMSGPLSWFACSKVSQARLFGNANVNAWLARVGLILGFVEPSVAMLPSRLY